MSVQKIKNYHVLSTEQFVKVIKKGQANGERFCFIFGAGASSSSGIPTCEEMEYMWMEEINEDLGFEETRELAESLKIFNVMSHNFQDIETEWEKAKTSGRTSLPIEYYFDIYKLRFYPNYRNGSRYLDEKIENAKLSSGYYPLALILANSVNNLVVTTNYDSLVEQAIFLYTKKTPLVVNQEFLSVFDGGLNTKRPIIAKLRTNLFFAPYVKGEEEAYNDWEEALSRIFLNYTPIIIGYSGCDDRLLRILKKGRSKLKNSFYWCYVDDQGLPNEKVQEIVTHNNGYLVRTGGFDAVMLAIGNTILADKMEDQERDETFSIPDKKPSTNPVLSTKFLVRKIKEGRRNKEKFCFILGAGASVSSNIPSGAELEYIWMEDMAEELEDIRAIAETLKSRNAVEHDFREIEQSWQNAKASGITSLPSEYYFDIYTLRFYPKFSDGYRYLEEKMEKAKPSFGYYSLALMLSEEGDRNLVVTTNFDTLVEDSMLLYTEKKPIVINHELLADFATHTEDRRPVIAKLHRGLFFDPFNRAEEVKKLHGSWKNVLKKIFENYITIVIGYGGGDGSLMGLLEEKDTQIKQLYWCYMEEYGLPGIKIQNVVNNQNGHFVRIGSFDAVMYAIGNKLFPDKIGQKSMEEYVSRRFSNQLKYLEAAYSKAVLETESIKAKDYFQQGNDAFNEDDYEKAIALYAKALVIQPEDKMLYYMRGFAYLRSGKYNESIADFNQALKLEPNSAKAYNNRGCAYMYLGETEKAIADFMQAIKCKPNFANPYMHLGTLYKKQGNLRKAEEYLTMAIDRNQQYKAAYRERAKIYRVLGEPEKTAFDEQAAAKL